ncbi:rod shape-determining protein [Gilvimarinus agarilyticus]|uniref:rod shape-determining protein n=1 Tax=unclassified Gilvimarinus TaxID=2642066 RepID=UPI001C084E6B|nr:MULTISPECIES: rod shape-determining protein [unclassified Gilvimarinus]MBU2886550.1 rod shape-determining protein [Gilvimarinus agarilyticus]MDO6571218.1 rod shape-determining protein [Gilvimarinus sp. 2_MG-2023]MDO6746400.1 rod shape-determining protein [Gilvimarinus sp. 1_MG-2023]
MIKSIRNIFVRTFYVQMWENRLRVQPFGACEAFDEKPFIALNIHAKKPKIVAIGNAAYDLRASTSLRVLNPFSHPRLLVAHFIEAEQVLSHALRSHTQFKPMLTSPIVVMHPREKLEGGVTGIETRLYQELALGAGAWQVHLHTGDELPIETFNPNLINH